ncbi:MAG: hypothetical protein B6243_04490 [Anaerolineaceae bacterium 4572_5.2]|nr:MAG: hypothetical protein B6243_04490 [Anaerolineaceae bacterium 4572_5.2]
MKTLRWILPASLILLGVGGGFAPWVYRPPAALQLTAPGLAEFVKFLAEARLGLLPIQRLHFLLPLATAALSLPLVAGNRQLGLHWSLNGLLRLLVLPMSLALLSPVWSPGVLLNQEFRLQTFSAGAAVALAIIAPLFKTIPLKYLTTSIAALATLSLTLALRQFYLVDDAIGVTYAGAIQLGWGGWLTIIATTGLVISTGVEWNKILRRRTNDE